MDNKKFEQLIELVINEDQEKAEQLFHEIVVEKSREIYESIMDEEMMGMDEGGMGGQVGDLMDEINAEEMSEEEDPMDDMGDEEEIVDIDADDMGADEEHEEIEDAVVRIEDKLDQLMSEFEELMGKEEGEEAGEEDFGGEEEGAEEMGGEEDLAEDMEEEHIEEADEMDEEEVMEAITLKKVSVTHGDNGQNTKSTALTSPKVKAAGVNPVKFSGASEAVPTSPKGPSNAYSKGETQVKGAGNFKNAPAKDNFSEKGEAAPKPKHGDDGQNTKSPLGESRKVAKKRI